LDLFHPPSDDTAGAHHDQKTDAALPYADAFATVASLVAQWLLVRKRLESWLFWIVVDVVSIAMYAMKGLFLTSGLYAVFLVMAAAGFLAWRKGMQQIPTA